MPSSQYLALSQISAAAFLWVMQLTTLHQSSQLTQLSGRGICAALFVSVVACVLCYAVLYWLLNYIDGHKLAMFEGLHAVSGAFLGYVIFNEKISFSMFLGGFLILLSLAISQFPKARPAEEPVSI
jgi:drug/metabolite transporter (DMT)-like permease